MSKPVVLASGLTSSGSLGLLIVSIASGDRTGIIAGSIGVVLGLVSALGHVQTTKGNANVGIQQEIDGLVSRLRSVLSAIGGNGGIVQTVEADVSDLEKVVQDFEKLLPGASTKTTTDTASTTEVPPPAPSGDFSKLTTP